MPPHLSMPPHSSAPQSTHVREGEGENHYSFLIAIREGAAATALSGSTPYAIRKHQRKIAPLAMRLCRKIAPRVVPDIA
eukprot:282153-Rhodomonas_salina.1